MYNNDEVFWINETLYSHKDKHYHSDGYLELTCTTTTSNYIKITKPRITISIDNNNQRRVCSLDYSDVSDLINTFKSIENNLKEIYSNPQNGDITKRYNKNRDLLFEFRLEPNTREPLVIIKIVFNESDQGKIIITLKKCIEIINIIKSFKEDYISYIRLLRDQCRSLQLDHINNKLMSIETTLKILPTQFSFDSSTSKEPEEVDIDTSTIDEFKEFVEKEEDNVVIPELNSPVIEPQEPITQEFTSILLDKVFKGDIQIYEQMINSVLTSDNPLLVIMENINEGMVLLPGISKQDMKSLCYISNYFFKGSFRAYVEQNAPFSPGPTEMKYQPSHSSEINIELAHDLLMISSYLKLYRNRREAIESDAFNNGAIPHYFTRCYLDVLYLSFIQNQSPEAIIGYIIPKFKFYQENGFFNYYDRLLKDHNLQSITTKDMHTQLEITLKPSSPIRDINELHKELFDKGFVKLPPKNDLSAEQILNVMVPLEIDVMFGAAPKDKTLDPVYLKLFENKKPIKQQQTKHVSEPRKKETSIVRWSKLKENNIPETFRDNFLKNLEEMKNKDFDFSNNSFALEEVGDEIIKGLYIWNESDKKDSYTNYVVKVEDCISRDLILAKIKEIESLEDNTGSEGNWMDGANLNL